MREAALQRPNGGGCSSDQGLLLPQELMAMMFRKLPEGI
jgi:hypothetical protein